MHSHFFTHLILRIIQYKGHYYFHFTERRTRHQREWFAEYHTVAYRLYFNTNKEPLESTPLPTALSCLPWFMKIFFKITSKKLFIGWDYNYIISLPFLSSKPSHMPFLTCLHDFMCTTCMQEPKESRRWGWILRSCKEQISILNCWSILQPYVLKFCWQGSGTRGHKRDVERAKS